MSWNQRHCKYYQILILMTIHESKSKLERPRYHENWNDALIDALQTSESHNFWSDRWIFELHNFLEIENQDISKGVKIGPIRGGLRPAAGGLSMAIASIFMPETMNSPRHTLDKGIDIFLKFSFYPAALYIFSLSKTPKISKYTPQKTHRGLLILPFSPKLKLLLLHSIFLSLVLHFGFGV